MVDWYWCQGNRHLEHWVHNAYGKAKYRKYLKWAVMWANHNPPNTHSAEDWRKVTQYWIDNYFNMPEYYRIDNRPAVFIWAPHNVRHDLGGSGEAAKLYAMSQEMAKAAGYPGIYFVAMSAHDNPERTKELVSEGYEAATTYHGFQLAWQRAQSDRFPFAGLLDTCPELWREAEKSARGPALPADRRHRLGRPALARRQVDRGLRPHARTVRQALPAGPAVCGPDGQEDHRPRADERMGRGELHRAVRRIRLPGSRPGPRGVLRAGRLAAEPDPGRRRPRTLRPAAGRRQDGLGVQYRRGPGRLDGQRRRRRPGGEGRPACGPLDRPRPDPPGARASRSRPSRLHRLSFRLRSDRDQRVQVFWATTLTAMSGEASLGIEVVGDGQFHDYEMDLAQSPHWRGVVTILRIDPATEPDAEFAFDYVRLH